MAQSVEPGPVTCCGQAMRQRPRTLFDGLASAGLFCEACGATAVVRLEGDTLCVTWERWGRE